MSFKKRTSCRSCGYAMSRLPPGIKAVASGERLVEVLNFGPLPLPNAFREETDLHPGYYPISLLVCPRCTLGQLSAVVDPLVMYANYPYVTSPSKTMAEHFQTLWSALRAEGEIENIVEIGSNDGLFLEFCKQHGAVRVLGIDPAENLVKAAKSRGVDSLCGLFDSESARMAADSMGRTDLVVARHVFCHIDDWQSFIHNVGVLCGKETIVCIEVPWAHDMLSNGEWDTIYAEHTSYLTIKSMQYLLDKSLLRLQRIIHFPIHGGAIAMILRRRDSEAKADGSVQEFIEKECCSIDNWKGFGEKAKDQIACLKQFVQELISQGKRIAGYGASAKGTMWMNLCGFTRKHIEFVCDSTNWKLFKNVPGTDIPVVAEDQAYVQCIDYAILWSWNFEQEIVKKQHAFLEGGGKFIIPVPTIRIVEK